MPHSDLHDEQSMEVYSLFNTTKIVQWHIILRFLDTLIRDITPLNIAFVDFVTLWKYFKDYLRSSLQKVYCLAFWTHTIHMVYLTTVKCCSIS